MPKTLVLSVNAVNRTLTLVSSDGLNEVFEEQTGPLIGRLRFTSSIKENGAKTVSRIKFKLERHQVDVTTAAPGIPAKTAVRYSEVWSDDITIVKAGEAAGRTELLNFKTALFGNAAVKLLITDGVAISS